MREVAIPEDARLSNQPEIAVVDDDKAMREALLDLLQVEGLAARPFESATALLAAMATHDFDCIITDVRMPETDGLELQGRLRARGLAMPVVFVTSLDDPATRARALKGGAAAWFTKPVDDAALLHELRTLLESNGKEPLEL